MPPRARWCTKLVVAVPCLDARRWRVVDVRLATAVDALADFGKGTALVRSALLVEILVVAEVAVEAAVLSSNLLAFSIAIPALVMSDWYVPRLPWASAFPAAR